MIIIVIDPGHGGKDSGAIGHNLQEKNLTLIISKKIKQYLDENYKEHKTILTRYRDETLSYLERVNVANKNNADFFLSVHVNAAGGTGFESFIYSGMIKKLTKVLRATIHKEIIKNIGANVKNRGEKEANFYVLRNTNCPAMISENLFIDRKEDAEKLKDERFIEKIVIGHAEGLAKAFNLKK